MSSIFDSKFNNKEYISSTLYLNELKENPNKLNNFDIDKYNNEVLENEYEQYKEYFLNMYKGIDDNILLDKEQIRAILSDEDFSLIIAGAGTGKTTTMASKVKYLVDKKGINPSDILVMSFTKKATEELEKRILIDFGIPANIMTFHSLGLMYIREIFKNRKCYAVDENIRTEIFMQYFNEKVFPNKEILSEVITLFDTIFSENYNLFSKYLKENFNNYSTYEELFNAYKNKRLNEALLFCNDTNNLKNVINEKLEKDLNREVIYTIKGEMVKSKGEAIIANFLFCNNIDYKYEKVYKELMNDRKTYRPDFTLNYALDEIYIEYFGLSLYKDSEMSTYNKIRKIKEDYHKKNNTKFIKLDYEKGENLIDTLYKELIKYGIKVKPKTDEEIFMSILDRNKCSLMFKFKNFLYNCIDLIKASSNRDDLTKIVKDYFNTLNNNKEEKYNVERQFYYIFDFYKYYQQKLYGASDYGFDFSDMIYYANKYIERMGSSNKLKFKYIIIDEYQDISQERYELTKKIVNKNNSKLVAVGDDWQSIYGFSGSRVEYTYNFLKYFEGAKLFKITNTYRNSKSLVNYSGKFVMKNDLQIKKDLVSNKEIYKPVRFIMFEDGKEYEYLKKLILQIHNTFPNKHILILGRTRSIINRCFKEKELIDSIGTKVEYLGYEDIDIDAMTMHKSKGLTSDEVILIGLDQNFPSEKNSLFWLEYLLKPKLEEEPISFAEERRLFYVALTRTRNYVYLLINNNPKKRSLFINELYQIIKEEDVK